MLDQEKLSTAPLHLSQPLAPLTAAAAPSGTFSTGGDFDICQGTPRLYTLLRLASRTRRGVVFRRQADSFLQLSHSVLWI